MSSDLELITIGRVGVDLYPEQIGVPLAKVRTFAKSLGGSPTNVAVAAARHLWWPDDEDFGRECALPLLVETARLWMSLGYYGADKQFHSDGITGPDEYTALCDDNIYTNLVAA